ncbi:MFS transporter [Streptomyces sp. NPDC051320]|uniref:MFS transporter n=1 Tax=Streptomyces sp. NPDC051320 TaxID=3154644 RepID=UPI00343BBADD
MCRDFGASTAAAGAVAAAFGTATIASRLLGGLLADRIGRRRMSLIGLLGCAVAQLGFAAAPDLSAAASCAVLLGLAFELYEPPSQAMMADGTRPALRAQTYALLTTALAVGNTGGGLIAALALALRDRRGLMLGLRAGRVPRHSCRPHGGRRFRRSPPDFSQPARLRSPWRDRALLATTAEDTIYALVYMLIVMTLLLSLAASDLNPARAGVLMAAATVALVVARPLLRTRLLGGLPAPDASATGCALMAAGLTSYASHHHARCQRSSLRRSLGAFETYCCPGSCSRSSPSSLRPEPLRAISQS